MRNKIPLLVAILFFQTIVYAQPELTGFYKLNFGISKDMAKSIIEKESDENGIKGTTKEMTGGLKWVRSKFANKRLDSDDFNEFIPSIKLYFYKDRLHTAVVPFSTDDTSFDEVKSEISEKYFPCDISEGWWLCQWTFKGGDYIKLNYIEYDFFGKKKSRILLSYVCTTISNSEKSDKTNENMKYY